MEIIYKYTLLKLFLLIFFDNSSCSTKMTLRSPAKVAIASSALSFRKIITSKNSISNLLHVVLPIIHKKRAVLNPENDSFKPV